MRLGVFIGRCQPFHDGHKSIVDKMRQECDNVLVLLGSANAERSMRNPWTFKERKNSILAIYPELTIEPLNDHLYDNSAWVAEVKSAIRKHSDKTTNVVIYGHTKDDTEYLKWFPDYDYEEVVSENDVNGTAIRTALFFNSALPEKVLMEKKYALTELDKFSDYPYPETLNFLTADVLLVCDNNVLLVKRANYPGKGSWAMPGGFKNQNESLVECAARELFEETGVTLKDYWYGYHVADIREFSSPKRSLPNSTIPRTTMVFLINLHTKKLPVLKANDDAAECGWFPIYDIMNKLTMFSDHRDIIGDLLDVRAIPAHRNKIYGDDNNA